MKKYFKKAAVVASGAVATLGAVASQAAVDVAGVTTELAAAEASSQSVGTAVIGVVAGIAAVSIIIMLIRRI